MNFSNFPVNTLVGADLGTFKAVTQGRHVAQDKRIKMFLTRCICRLLSLFAHLQERKYQKLLANEPLQHDPLFILGHWRSGTTFVHNIFAQDPRFGFTTTYQTVFPHYMMAMQWLFKPIFAALMPKYRPTDKMELSPDLPQEEEFAIVNTCPVSYYNFWFYPQSMQEYCDRFLTMKQATPEEIADFKDKFLKLVKISMWNSRRGVKDAQYLSKNPPHTGKVKTLVEMFPNAKFIYLIRDPYTVFESSRSFFTQTIASLELNSITVEEMEQNILYSYKELYDAYQEQKKYIPEGNLFEVKFEEFEKDALNITERIYRELGIPGWDEARPAIEAYIGKKKDHKKNKYAYDPRTISMVNQAWGDILDTWDYRRL
ncbi:MAG: sulfotransferase [Bacteroidaceae bacterium]|nr:sulfotransferase [Bacteroidaceae bacterium]